MTVDPERHPYRDRRVLLENDMEVLGTSSIGDEQYWVPIDDILALFVAGNGTGSGPVAIRVL